VVRLKGPVDTFTETIESYWLHGKRVILKFSGRDRPDQAQILVGCEVQVPEEQAYPLPEDTYYDDDLIGCRVVEGERDLGLVSGIFKVGREVTNLVVLDQSDQEYMVPLVREFVTEIDIEGCRIEVKLPPGLIEMTAVSAKPPRKRA
jgi:16S rRNA processing protein RimM